MESWQSVSFPSWDYQNSRILNTQKEKKNIAAWDSAVF